MQVEFLKRVLQGGFICLPGKISKVSDEMGKSLIARGLAKQSKATNSEKTQVTQHSQTKKEANTQADGLPPLTDADLK